MWNKQLARKRGKCGNFTINPRGAIIVAYI
jgi:hypothetical protein